MGQLMHVLWKMKAIKINVHIDLFWFNSQWTLIYGYYLKKISNFNFERNNDVLYDFWYI